MHIKTSNIQMGIMFICLFIFIYILYYTRKTVLNLKFWKKRKINYIQSWPFLGSFASNIFRKHSMVHLLQNAYRKYPDAQVVGIHQFNKPVLLIRDPELIRLITVKQFENFSDHTTIITEDIDPLFGKNLLSLKGHKWKRMRSTLSPAFTSSKMKTMYVLIKECAEKFSQYFLKETDKGNKIVLVEMKDVFSRYTNDVIASCAFGIKCDSLDDKKNDFFMTGKKCLSFSVITLMRLFGYLYAMPLMKFFSIKIFGGKVENFFKSIIKKNVEMREKENIVRPDMIHLLMEAQKGQLKRDQSNKNQEIGFATVEESNIGQIEYEDKLELTIDDITAQAILFFLAGYETGSTLMSFLAYELALNPDIQKKLQDEVDQVVKNSNASVTYETLLGMKYLDMVISECLRKWPPSMVTERLCSKDYSLKLQNRHLRIDKGFSIWMPVYSLHHDEKYFPNPEKFDPERFNDENKNNILPFTYIPFGAGPRNCIGSRFALLEMKALYVHLLAKFDIIVTEKTQIPLKINKTRFNLLPENGFWLGLKARS